MEDMINKFGNSLRVSPYGFMRSDNAIPFGSGQDFGKAGIIRLLDLLGLEASEKKAVWADVGPPGKPMHRTRKDDTRTRNISPQHLFDVVCHAAGRAGTEDDAVWLIRALVVAFSLLDGAVDPECNACYPRSSWASALSHHPEWRAVPCTVCSQVIAQGPPHPGDKLWKADQLILHLRQHMQS